jgi:hypothetical protein
MRRSRRSWPAPEPQKSCLRTKVIGIMIKHWASHCSEQHRGGSKASSESIGRKRVVRSQQSGAADVLLLELQLMSEGSSGGSQNRDRLLCHFRTNSVSRKNGEVKKHGELV